MSSETQLDHVVIAVQNLDDASRAYRALGFNVVAGGVHGHAPTRNALIAFSDESFIELIEWTAHAPRDAWLKVLERDGDGLVDFALTTQDLHSVITRGQSNGYEMNGPIAGSRMTPDGVLLRWQTVRPASRGLPFLCLDVTARAERVPTGDVRLHPNGVTGVSAVVIAVADADATLDGYRRVLGADDGGRSVLTELGVCVGVANLENWQFVLVNDTRPADTPIAARVHEFVARRGESPCALILRSPNIYKSKTIKPADACGVPLRLCADREPPESYLDSML